MKKLRAFVVDDEPIARQTVRALLAEDPEIEVVGDSAGVEALGFLPDVRPDLLFLDIEMPEVSGFDVIASLPPENAPIVIFVTAFDAYAVKAFEVHAVDYLLKPFTDERFFAALDHAKSRVSGEKRDERLQELLEVLSRRGDPYMRRMLVRHNGRSILLRAVDIDWIEAADYYARLHVGKQSYLVREPVGELEKKLAPEQFFRVHRSAIVNLDRVREIHAQFKGDSTVVLHDGKQLTLARSRREELERVLGRLR